MAHDVNTFLTDDQREIVSKVEPCPDCGKNVIVCDNNVRLDSPPSQEGMWSMMKLAHMVVACSADESGVGSRHDLHDHQPPEVE